MSATVKRFLDVSFACLALLLLLPLLTAVAVAVFVSSRGSVLYRQRRAGRHGQPFTILKFRTMYESSVDLRNQDGSTSSPKNDPRVTNVGYLLRQTSLDELPQLWNVLCGDMSLVGPRPDQPDQLQHYLPGEHRKLEMKPGITGLAQINGRNSIPWAERRMLDCLYVERWSLWLDITILARTVPYVLLRRNIHTKGHSDEYSLHPSRISR